VEYLRRNNNRHVQGAEKMRKVVYIAGAGHSGSTILDMSLGCHPSIIGLGEMINLLSAKKEYFYKDAFNNILCSCGHNMYNCDFWSGAREELLKYSGENIHIKCQHLIDYFFQKYGEDKILVDSSKNLHGYIPFLNDNFSLNVLFLIRDFRSWIYSRYCRHGKNMISLAYRWLKANIRTKQYLARHKIIFMTVGYEELSLYPELLLRTICDFIGVEYDPIMLQPGNTKSHIIRGNVARGDNEKKKGFFYDARWFTSVKLNMLGPIFLPMAKWNNDNVYSHFIKGETKAFGISQKDFIIFGDERKNHLVDVLKERAWLGLDRQE